MRKFVAGAAACLFVASANAANLVDVYEAALQNDPVLGSAKDTYYARKELVPQARSYLLPYASAGAYTAWNEREYPGAKVVDPTTGQTFSVPHDDYNEHAWQAGLTQPLFHADSYYNYKSAQSHVRGADYDYQGSQQDLIVRVVQAYLDILRAQAAVESSRAEEEAVRRQLEQVQQRFDVGLVAITDVLDAKAAYDGATVVRIQAEGDQNIFFETLTTLTGSRYAEIDRLAENLPIRDPDPTDQETWVQMALDTNLSVKSAREAVDAAKQDLRSRESGHLPTVDGNASYSEFRSDAFGFLSPSTGGTISDKTNTAVYRLNFSLPIYQGGYTQSKVREARELLLNAEDNLRNREWSVKRDTYNLLSAVSTDVVRVNARIRAIKSSESALEATQTGYEVGTRNIVDVLQAQQRLYLSQFDYADSRYKYVNDLLFLKETAGSLNEDDLNRLNSFSDSAKPVVRIAKPSPVIEVVSEKR
jgi:outer membrane protein